MPNIFRKHRMYVSKTRVYFYELNQRIICHQSHCIQSLRPRGPEQARRPVSVDLEDPDDQEEGCNVYPNNTNTYEQERARPSQSG